MSISLVTFHPADNPKELKKFIALPWKIYKGKPHWVPPLRIQVKEDLDTKKNPFYRHADICLWNAYKNGVHLGRIAAIIDTRHNDLHEERTGFFGFFECIEDTDISEKLFQAAEAWVKEQGMQSLRGPANPSLNHTAGLQVDAFDRSPMIMMTQNPTYYQQLIEAQGFAKAKDLLAYEMSPKDPFPEIIVKSSERAKKKNRISFRKINMKKFPEEVKLIREIYNDAWEKNWGFVPMDDLEFEHMAKGLKDIIWPDFCVIGEVDGKAIGFSITLPDINQILKKIPSGKLLPSGLFKLLWGLNPKRKKINQVRVITLGVKKDYRRKGVESLFYLDAYKTANDLGLNRGEMSWLLEDNHLITRPIERMAGAPSKRYRIFEKTI